LCNLDTTRTDLRIIRQPTIDSKAKTFFPAQMAKRKAVSPATDQPQKKVTKKEYEETMATYKIAQKAYEEGQDRKELEKGKKASRKESKKSKKSKKQSKKQAKKEKKKKKKKRKSTSSEGKCRDEFHV
jgi:hypothetical protein